MNILHISDTHGFHEGFPQSRFKGIHLVIHSGDCSNHRNPALNEPEVRRFIEWYKDVPVEHKIYVAGNHDTSIEARMINKSVFTEAGIIYLENEGIEISGWKIWGSPYTPMFAEWSFMKKREKINRVWETIPDDINILITHGPPKGVRDLSIDRDGTLELCGDGALGKRCDKLKSLQFHCFGHIHNVKNVLNAGMSINSGSDITYSNGSCVTDARFEYGLTSFGNIVMI